MHKTVKQTFIKRVIRQTSNVLSLDQVGTNRINLPQDRFKSQMICIHEIISNQNTCWIHGYDLGIN